MKYGVFIIVVLLLFACNKSERNAKWMDGSWTIYSYAQITSGGFVTYYPAEGTISFRETGSGNLSMEENFVYYTPTGTITINRTGIIRLNGKKGLDADITITEPNEVTIFNETIHLLTRDDLKIEYRESGIGHLFVLQKD